MPFLPGNNLSTGRPKASHTLQTEKARELLIKTVYKELKPILEAQLDSAKGLWYEKTMLDGTVKVYKDRPNIEAGKYLLDQTIGKAKESVQLSGGIALLVLDE